MTDLALVDMLGKIIGLMIKRRVERKITTVSELMRVVRKITTVYELMTICMHNFCIALK